MYETHKTTREVDEIIAIKCDGCPRIISINNGQPSEDFIQIAKSWSDGKFKDERHTFHLCQECYEKIINHFDLRIEVGKVINGRIVIGE